MMHCALRKTFLAFCLTLLSLSATMGQNDTLSMLFRNSYKVFELQRNHLGIYRDSKLFSGTDYHPASVANCGMGLIALCIADAMGWESDAMDYAKTTLKSLTGNNLPFNPDRNNTGYFRHFIDMNTGARAWDSEYSTIDTDILVSGALFAKNYFQNDSITYYADLLWNSIDFTSAVADPDAGKIYLKMDESGNGIYTLPLPGNDTVLWRYSLNDTLWRASEVQGIDFSTMLFGLASLPEFLGTTFFETHNDFFNTGVSDIEDTSPDHQHSFTVSVYPNPGSEIMYAETNRPVDNLTTLNLQGQSLNIPLHQTANRWVIDISQVGPGAIFLIFTCGKSRVTSMQWIL